MATSIAACKSLGGPEVLRGP